MTAPEHLWSGDWEAESEAAARRRRAGARLPAPPPDPGSAPEPSAPPRMGGDPLQRGGSESPTFAPARDRRPLHIPWRPLGIALLTALVVVAAALGLSALVRGDGGHAAAARPGWIGLRLGVLPTGAVVVTSLPSGSPAAAAGVRTGDVITEIQGRPVAAPVDVALAVDALGAGQTIELGGLHDARAYTTQVRLADRPAGAAGRGGP